MLLLTGAAVNQVSKKHPAPRTSVRSSPPSSASASLGSSAHTARPTSPAGRASGCWPTCATTSSGTRSASRSSFYEEKRRRRPRQPDDERHVEALDQLVTDGVVSLLQNTLTLVGAAVLMFILSWQLALATLTIIPPLVVGTAIFRKKVEPQLSARPRDARRGHRDPRRGHRGHPRPPGLHARGGRDARTSAWSARTTCRRRNQETVIQNALYFLYVDLLSSLATAIILGYGAYLVFDTKTSYGVLDRLPRLR